MRQCLCKAVCGNVVGDIIRGGLGGIAGVAAVAKGDGLLPRQAQMGQRVGQAVGLAAARACTVDSGSALAWNGSSVPSISKNAALICVMAVFLIRA